MLNQEEIDYLRHCVDCRATTCEWREEVQYSEALACGVPKLIETIEALQDREKHLRIAYAGVSEERDALQMECCRLQNALVKLLLAH